MHENGRKRKEVFPKKWVGVLPGFSNAKEEFLVVFAGGLPERGEGGDAYEVVRGAGVAC